MNAYLTRLGVPLEVQAFFEAGEELYFDFGGEREHFSEDYHFVPTTRNLWLAGSDTAGEIIVTYSAMEAMAFLTVNRVRYPKPEQLLLIAIGNRLQRQQSDWIRQHFRKRKFTLVFGNDLTGHCADIKLTAALKGFEINIRYADRHLIIDSAKQTHIFSGEEISLHRFRLAFGIRASIRTRKSTKSITFLDQLKHDINR